MLKKYELLYIIPNKFTDAEAEKINEDLKKYLVGKDCQIIKAENFGKKKLAYEIKHYFYGYFFLMHFDAEPAVIADFDKKMRLNADILRHMIIERPKIYVPLSEAVNKDENEEEAPQAKPAHKTAPAPEIPVYSAPAVAKETKEPITKEEPIAAPAAEEEEKPKKSARGRKPKSVINVDAKKEIKIENPEEALKNLDQKLDAIFKDEDIKL